MDRSDIAGNPSHRDDDPRIDKAYVELIHSLNDTKAMLDARSKERLMKLVDELQSQMDRKYPDSAE